MGWGRRVIVISHAVGRHMIDDFGVPPERIRLVHRGIDLSQFHYSVSRYDSLPKVYRIINVARLSPIKGQIEFLRAVHLLKNRLQQIEVWLVGSEGRGKHKYTDLIKQTIRQLGLGSCVKLLGTRRDIPELLAQSDLAVLSTLVPEAFGRVIVEAGATGCAVLSTRVGGVLDIVDHDENGVLVPPGDMNAMADGMFRLLTDRERSKLYAARLRAKIERCFTLEQMVDRTLEVYQEIKRERKILIIKLGAAGDLILAVPSLRMIRQRFPDAHISLMVDKKLAALVSGTPYLDEIFPVDRKKLPGLSYLLKLAKQVRAENYDVSVDLQNSKWTHLLAYLGGIGERFGFSRGKFGFLVNRPDRTFEVREAPVRHQFRVLSKLGVKDYDEKLELWTDPRSDERVRAWLGEGAPDSKWVGLVLGSSPQWPTKRWPLSYFCELAQRLVQHLNCRVVLIGSDLDREFLEQNSLKQAEGVLDLVGKTTLADLVSLVRHMDVLVTGDTAPLHVAGAFQKKIVALFGPTDPVRHMPPGQGAVVLTRYLSCQPCYEGICRHEEKLACLRHISVEEVLAAVEKQLASVEKREHENSRCD